MIFIWHFLSYRWKKILALLKSSLGLAASHPAPLPISHGFTVFSISPLKGQMVTIRL